MSTTTDPNVATINRMVALAAGRDRAKRLLGVGLGRRAADLARAAKPNLGWLIAECNSWGDLPLKPDLVSCLEDLGYHVANASRHGDTAENMAYNRGGAGRSLVRCFQDVVDALRDGHDPRTLPRAIILSAGGNDFVDMLPAVLRHFEADPNGIDWTTADACLYRLEETLTQLVGLVQELGEQHWRVQLPVLIHGYAHPWPDGRGFFGMSLVGPWLKPIFARKGYHDLLATHYLISGLINTFNKRLEMLAKEVEGVHYVDLRPVIQTNASNYREWWTDELHLTRRGYEPAAAALHDVIQRLPAPKGVA